MGDNTKQTGPLRHISLAGFLQLLETERGDCTLVVDSPHEGYVYVKGGVIVGATNPLRKGIEATYDILCWRDPSFRSEDFPENMEEDFRLSISHMLMEAARRCDELSKENSKPEFDTKIEEIYLDDTEDDFEVIVDEEIEIMADIQETLETAYNIDGTIGVALVDWESGMSLGSLGSGIDLEVAAAGNTEVVRAKQRVMEALGIQGGIKDILITLEDQYHIIVPLSGASIFLYSALRKDKANLALARMKLVQLGDALKL